MLRLLSMAALRIRSKSQCAQQGAERDGGSPSPAPGISSMSHSQLLSPASSAWTCQHFALQPVGRRCPGIEDHAVFPLLATRMDVSKLQQDHAEMDAIIEDIEQACLSSVGSPEVHTLTVCCVPTLSARCTMNTTSRATWRRAVTTGMRDQGWGSAHGCPDAAAGIGIAAHAAGRGVYDPTKAAGSRLHSNGGQPYGVTWFEHRNWVADRLWVQVVLLHVNAH